MPDHTSRLPARPSIEQLRKQAKELLRDLREGDDAAINRLLAGIPRFTKSRNVDSVNLADAQFVVAREHGFENWAALVRQIEAMAPGARLSQYEKLAEDLVSAYNSSDLESLQRLNQAFLSSFTVDHLRANVQQRLSLPKDVTGQATDITLPDAQRLIAGLYAFASWESFAESIKQAADPTHSGPHGLNSSPPFFRIDRENNTIEPRAPLSDRDWDTIFGVMKEQGISGLNAGGTMTDSVIQRLCELNHVTRVNLGGSKRLSDDGLNYLARMPQLLELDLSDYPGGVITDRGLEVVRHLTELRRFQMCWQSGVSDAGVANLAFCEKLETVDLLGTPTGDGAVKALIGKDKLRHFKTGGLVTDAALPLLQQYPAFRFWQGGKMEYALSSPDAEPTHLLLDGPFTNNGLTKLAQLEGLFGLSFFWHASELTADGLRGLADLPNLGFLGCEGELCNDTAMRHIASMPRLRMLMGQGTVAGDDGFTELSRSQTIEYIWGRECPNLGGRGFAALAAMPALKGLSVSCKNVDDAGLSALPCFPSLTELMPMDLPDAGFRYVGRCERLESLVLMYCRDTTDAATEYLADLPRLKKYFASYNKITDRSMEVLSGIPSLEEITFYGCPEVTNVGVEALARLPRLRELHVSGPGITRECAAAFPAHVRVEISV